MVARGRRAMRVRGVRVLGWVSVSEPREIAIIAHLCLVSASVGSCASLVGAVSNSSMSQLGLSFVTWLVIVGGGGTGVGWSSLALAISTVGEARPQAALNFGLVTTVLGIS